MGYSQLAMAFRRMPNCTPYRLATSRLAQPTCISGTSIRSMVAIWALCSIGALLYVQRGSIMHSPNIMTLAVRNAGLSFALLCAASGCGSLYELYATPGVTLNASRQGNYEDPDGYRVDAAAFPSFKAVMRYSPPSPTLSGSTSRVPMVDISPEDVWRVTHRVGTLLAAFSTSYQLRQCIHMLGLGVGAGAFRPPSGGTCQTNYLYHLLISPDGRVHGWLGLHNPQRVVAARDRYVPMDPELRKGPGWPVDPLLRPITP